jgi:hypothetical protein
MYVYAWCSVTMPSPDKSGLDVLLESQYSINLRYPRHGAGLEIDSMWLLVVCLLKGVKLAVQFTGLHGMYAREQVYQRCNCVPSVVANAQHNAFCLSVLVCVSCWVTSESGGTATVRLLKLKIRFGTKPNQTPHTPWLPKKKTKLRPREVAAQNDNADDAVVRMSRVCDITLVMSVRPLEIMKRLNNPPMHRR